ncbi:meiotic recombination protein SPO11-like isoform X1 [Mytilus galloprovincialis]|uniref:meiotic recombination protein SPO11-like isoform X1 n=1 Tax=Mytilus galloprovincialis TaxID=29158 RepID=UPI003F7BCE48
MDPIARPEFWSCLDQLYHSFPMENYKPANIPKRILSKADVLQKIQTVMNDVMGQMSSGESPTMKHINRSTWENISFKENIGLQMVNDPKMTTVRYESPQSTKKFALMIKVMSIMFTLVQTDKYCTKRDLFYQDPTFFGNQMAVDEAVDNISCMLQIPRWHLHVLGTSKGLLAGDLSFQDADGNFTSCNSTKNGVMVPSHVMGISFLQTNAKFVLIIEKDATFQKLLDDGFHLKFKQCILVTAKGFPDMNTRLLLKLLWDKFHIPMLALVDADPHGIEIMLIYKYGSKALAFESEYLAVPSVRWLGILPTDIKRFGIDVDKCISITSGDKNKISDLLSRPFLSSFPGLEKEIKLMLELKVKAEIQILDSLSPMFLSSVYLPGKLQYGGWI